MYKRDAACGEQWLLLRSVLPVEVVVSSASTPTALKIHSSDIANIKEAASWAPGEQAATVGSGGD